MNPLIYIAGQPVRNDETLRALGLGPLLDPAVSPLWSDVYQHTPDGGRGVLVQFDCPLRPQSSSPRGLHPERQQWREASKQVDLPRGRYWLGWQPEQRPTPADLRRSAQRTVSGETLTLLDGHLWEVAVSSFVPMRRGIDIATGLEVRLPQTPFVPFVERCREWEALFVETGQTAESLAGSVLRLNGAYQFAAEALAMNYRVVPDLVDALELIGDEEIFQIVLAAVGITTMAAIELQKKTA